jgi:site-specific DNA recombinase
MRQAVMYTRVSSKDQEREGYSIPAQQVLLREYAVKPGFQIVREFMDVETAKVAGRKAFGEMVSFLKQHRDCRVVLAEKTDRLYRNFKDYVVLEDLDIEIHLPKEGHIIGKDSRSHDRLIHGIKVVLARNYIDNLREEVTKGLRAKAEQGTFPGGRPPLGYRNHTATHTIEIHPDNAPIVRRMFEIYATGNYSLSELRRILRDEFSIRIPCTFTGCCRTGSTSASSSGAENNTRAPTRRLSAANDSIPCRKYSIGPTVHAVKNMSSRFRDCCSAPMTVAPSQLR